MCTRYYVELSPELRPFIEAARNSPLRQKMVSHLGKPFKASGEIRPTDMTTVIAPDRSGAPSVFPMVWGYHIAGLNRPVVNARVETADKKKNFAEDWKKHRCVIPASWYFEWKHIKSPDGTIRTGSKYAIQPRNSTVTFLAGLYRIEETHGFRYPVFTVLTREPSEELLAIHDRMPLILPAAAVNAWIAPDETPEKIIRHALTDMAIEKAGSRESTDE